MARTGSQGRSVSLPDYLLDVPGMAICLEHDCWYGDEEGCELCRLDLIDLYADAKIQDAKEGK